MRNVNQFFNNQKKDKSKAMSEMAAAAAKAQMRADQKVKQEEKPEPEVTEESSDEIMLPTDLAKTTKLVFFRKYDTYQALLEVIPKEGLSVKDCFSKVVLYIMRWFRNRLGDEVFEKYPDIAYLRSDYPLPEEYATFRIEDIHNIEGLNFLDLDTIYLPKKKAWIFRLDEPDNGQERADIQGRTFKTEISVYQLEGSVTLGIRESCREPDKNKEDAFGYRPGFVRDIFYDEQLLVGEQGLGADYAFGVKPIKVNGKSKEGCENIYNNLISSKNRQMPILFIPGDFYRDNKTDVNDKTASLVGYCHVVVWESTCRKLFETNMENEEFAEVAEEGQLIFYRTTANQEYPTDYYDGSAEGILSEIKSVAMHEPIRKRCDFGEFVFEPSAEDLIGVDDIEEAEKALAEEKRRLAEIKELRQRLGDYERDNDNLQRMNDKLVAENKQYDKDHIKNTSDLIKQADIIAGLEKKNAELLESNRRLEAEKLQKDLIIRGQQREEKERTLPLLNIPTKKEGILSWIEEWYREEIEINPGAEKSFNDDNRNIDWHKFCMMIHYLAGYTKYRNGGGPAINPHAAREYDPEEASIVVDPVSSGQGATEMYKDKYTITVNGEDVLLDMHIKSGKGSDSNMIRIYFYYSPELKKSVIGYMPGHLPTRKDSH